MSIDFNIKQKEQYEKYDLFQKAQVYKITYLIDGRYYIGTTWGKKMSYIRRFNSHMSGNGSIYIKHLLEQGAKKDDFKVELIKECCLSNALSLEAELSVLYPQGLNGNKGSAIVTFDLDDMYNRRNQTLKNLPDDIKKQINEKRSTSMKKFLKGLSDQEMKDRMKKSARNLTNEQKIQRGINISKGKKGKKTNQKEITISKYKMMSDDDFYSMISEWDDRYKNRAINMRNM